MISTNVRCYSDLKQRQIGYSQKFDVQATHLRVPVNAVCTPATWLYLVWVEAPEFQLLLKQRPANVCRVMEFPGTETHHYDYYRPWIRQTCSRGQSVRFSYYVNSLLVKCKETHAFAPVRAFHVTQRLLHSSQEPTKSEVCPTQHFVTYFLLSVRNFAEPQRWGTAPCQLSATLE